MEKRPRHRPHRQRLAQAEFPRQFLHHLHRDPHSAIQVLLRQHASRQDALLADPPPFVSFRQPGKTPPHSRPNTAIPRDPTRMPPVAYLEFRFPI